jgi:His Kinase A (phospho-acceptor) domain
VNFAAFAKCRLWVSEMIVTQKNRGSSKLRIDDRLETALRNSIAATGANLDGQWRQLIDLLAQNPRNFDEIQVAQGLSRLFELGAILDVAQRAECVSALTNGIRSAPLVQLLAFDAPEVASAAISNAQLHDLEWAEIIPHMGTRARGFLRLRRDLGPVAMRALAIWSSGDFLLSTSAPALPLEAANAVEVAELGWQSDSGEIGAIVKRIEKWRLDRETAEAPRLPFSEDLDHSDDRLSDELRFETDDNGTIIWAEGAPRGAIVGIDIARAAYDNGPGPDAYGAAAFRQRMPMDSARMRLRGASAVEGEWRISAAPFFDAASGRFRGFRGIMRRPTLVETAAPLPNEQQQSDQLHQIVHELRTPLGAIAGFAEIIEQQLFGPVSREYRDIADAIIGDANRLLAGFDDLTMAANIDRGQFDAEFGVTECGWLASRIKDRLQSISDNMDVKVNLVLADPVRPYAIEPELAERIFSRLLAAVIIGCSPGETLDGRFRTEIGPIAWNRFQLALPNKLCGHSEEDLLNSGPMSGSQPSGSPLLGLGFSLRLVRNLARNIGGDLHIHKESLLLSLPAAQDSHFHFKDNRGD